MHSQRWILITYFFTRFPSLLSSRDSPGENSARSFDEIGDHVSNMILLIET
jgi:hypothetical protein